MSIVVSQAVCTETAIHGLVFSENFKVKKKSQRLAVTLSEHDRQWDVEDKLTTVKKGPTFPSRNPNTQV